MTLPNRPANTQAEAHETQARLVRESVAREPHCDVYRRRDAMHEPRLQVTAMCSCGWSESIPDTPLWSTHTHTIQIAVNKASDHAVDENCVPTVEYGTIKTMRVIRPEQAG